MSDEERLHPFDIAGMVRSTTDLYDKRISALTDLFHQTQIAFTKVEQSVEYMKGRIDGGISPTMQKVKAQNDELEKAILRLETEMIKKFGELGTRVAVMDEHYAAPITDWKEFQRNIRSFFFKVFAAAMVPVIGLFATTWVWISQVREKIQALPTEYSVKRDVRR